jgi:wyosine [tRNA(Phe)-imidazoG37] synthetase (radical SAM superfamily)
MSERHPKHLFGPVPSRRFGRSLGIDLVPFKTCSFDCIFCQLGRTTRRTLARREYVPADEVIAELDTWLRSEGTADYITLAGSGEPTLNSEFGRIIDFARNATGIPVALLTNGSLLSDPEVRNQAAKASVVKVSLSAWNQCSLEQVNRPARGIEFKRLFEGQWLLRSQFRGELWLEVFLVSGINATAKDVAEIAELVKVIAPDRVQLNTAVRPPCEEFAYAVPEERLRELAQLFEPAAEVIAEYRCDASAKVQANEADILDLLERRPCTLEQIGRAFGLHRNEASKYLGKLGRSGRIRQLRKDGEVFYAGVRENTDQATAPG